MSITYKKGKKGINFTIILLIAILGLTMWDKFFIKGNPNNFVSFESKVDSLISITHRVNEKTNRIEKVYENTMRDLSYWELNNSKNNEIKDLRDRVKNLGLKVDKILFNLKLNVTTSNSNDDVDIIPLFAKIDSLRKIIINDSINIENKLDSTFFNKMYPYLAREYAFRDTTPHFKLNGLFDIVLKKLTYEHKYNANYELFAYYEKPLFKPRRLKLNIVSDDVNNSINTKTFYVNPPTEMFSIGINIGYGLGYNISSQKIVPSPYIGIGIQKPIFRIYKK
jgi:hypothetical protein